MCTLKRMAMIIAEGKTKIIHEHPSNRGLAVLKSKDDITAGDGKKHDLLRGKGVLANTTTCNVFNLLRECNIPVAFQEKDSETSFTASRCRMLPYEVIVRREAHGSYLDRNPGALKGQIFPQLIIEFHLKTKDKKWEGQDIPIDDPLIIRKDRTGYLYLKDRPISMQRPFMVIDLPGSEYFTKMAAIAKRTFLVLEKAWHLEGCKLVDLKVEFGLDHHDGLVLADVIDNDSWRLMRDGQYIDKQVYRDGADLAKVLENYRNVSRMSGSFKLPVQRITIWCGSVNDDNKVLLAEIDKYRTNTLIVESVICSAHKEPVKMYKMLAHLTSIDTVIVALVGRSNGAGPTLAANTHIPVIAVPASFDEFPEDVWSSLRLPGTVPLLTVLDQKNAALAAVQILATRNPALYANLREGLEERLANISMF